MLCIFFQNSSLLTLFVFSWLLLLSVAAADVNALSASMPHCFTPLSSSLCFRAISNAGQVMCAQIGTLVSVLIYLKSWKLGGRDIEFICSICLFVSFQILKLKFLNSLISNVRNYNFLVILFIFRIHRLKICIFGYLFCFTLNIQLSLVDNSGILSCLHPDN